MLKYAFNFTVRLLLVLVPYCLDKSSVLMTNQRAIKSSPRILHLAARLHTLGGALLSVFAIFFQRISRLDRQQAHTLIGEGKDIDI